MRLYELDKTYTYELLTPGDLRRLALVLNAEQRLYPQAVRLAQAQWARSHRTPFPLSKLAPRRVVRLRTFTDAAAAQTALRKADQELARRTSGSDGAHERGGKGKRDKKGGKKAKRKQAKGERTEHESEELSEAQELLRARMDELLGGGGGPAKSEKHEPDSD
ncbi:MAG: hypothetical protein JXR37_32035 [Kiritimatiellae bacterium]|nr:hypothetical protein [Kiritimatiellia bacterium]